MRRWASSSSETSTLIERSGMLIETMSPSRIRPIAPPEAASGLMWPSDSPDEPPENRPSVISAHFGPSPTPLR